MQLRAVLAFGKLNKPPKLSDVVCVDDQQYAIGFYGGNEAETEYGVLDDISERVLLSRKFYSGLFESTRSLATIKLGTLGAGNVVPVVNEVTGEEEARIKNFNLRPATKWTVRIIVYEDKDTVPNENPDYGVPFVVLEKSAQSRLNKLLKNKDSLPTELTRDAWDAMQTPNTVDVQHAGDGEDGHGGDKTMDAPAGGLVQQEGEGVDTEQLDKYGDTNLAQANQNVDTNLAQTTQNVEKLPATKTVTNGTAEDTGQAETWYDVKQDHSYNLALQMPAPIQKAYSKKAKKPTTKLSSIPATRTLLQ
jgi:hypothetical protein